MDRSLFVLGTLSLTSSVFHVAKSVVFGAGDLKDLAIVGPGKTLLFFERPLSFVAKLCHLKQQSEERDAGLAEGHNMTFDDILEQAIEMLRR